MNELAYVYELKKIIKKGLKLTDEEIAMFMRVSVNEVKEKIAEEKKNKKEIEKNLKKEMIRAIINQEDKINFLNYATKYVQDIHNSNINNYKLLEKYYLTFTNSTDLSAVKVGLYLSDYCENYHQLTDIITTQLFKRRSNKSLINSLLLNEEAINRLDESNQNFINAVVNIIDGTNENKCKKLK